MNTSIFKDNVLDLLQQNAAKPSKPIPDESIYQFSDAITDKELNDHIKSTVAQKETWR